MTGQLQNRVAIVTGGAKSLGRTFSRALAAKGASIVILDIADGGETADHITSEFDVPALAIAGDVRRRRRRPRIWNLVNRRSRL